MLRALSSLSLSVCLSLSISLLSGLGFGLSPGLAIEGQDAYVLRAADAQSVAPPLTSLLEGQPRASSHPTRARGHGGGSFSLPRELG